MEGQRKKKKSCDIYNASVICVWNFLQCLQVSLFHKIALISKKNKEKTNWCCSIIETFSDITINQLFFFIPMFVAFVVVYCFFVIHSIFVRIFKKLSQHFHCLKNFRFFSCFVSYYVSNIFLSILKFKSSTFCFVIINFFVIMSVYPMCSL